MDSWRCTWTLSLCAPAPFYGSCRFSARSAAASGHISRRSRRTPWSHRAWSTAVRIYPQMISGGQKVEKEFLRYFYFFIRFLRSVFDTQMARCESKAQKVKKQKQVPSIKVSHDIPQYSPRTRSVDAAPSTTLGRSLPPKRSSTRRRLGRVARKRR